MASSAGSTTVRPGASGPASLLAWAGPVLIAGIVAVAARGYEPVDVATLHDAGRALISGELAVYATHPAAQVGPLALALSALPRPVFVTVVCLLLAGLTLAARRLQVPDRTILLSGSLAAVVWGIFADGGHVDDQLVVLGAAGMVLGIAEQRRSWIGTGFVLAILGKPTAVVLAPLLLAAGWPAALAALGGGAALWAPFVLADVSGFLRAGHGIVTVRAWSGPFLLGEPVGGGFPPWVRPVQAVVGLLLCWVVGRGPRAVPAAMAAFAFWALLEPGAWPSYSIPMVALAVVLTERSGLLIGLAFGSWLSGWYLIASPGPVAGLLRAVLLVALIVVAWWPSGPGLRRRAAGLRTPVVPASGSPTSRAR